MASGIATRVGRSQAWLAGARVRAARHAMIPAVYACLVVLMGAAGPTSASTNPAHQLEESHAPPPVKVERYDIWVAFHPEETSLRARATLKLRAEKPVQAVEMELSPQLQISKVTDGDGNSLSFVRSGRIGSPNFLVTLSGETAGEFTLHLSYSGNIAGDELDYVNSKGILLRDESGWYPTPDMTAFAPHRIHMVLPDGWTAVAGGDATVFHRRDRAIFDFVTSRPVYSRAIAAAPYQVQAVHPASADGAAPLIRVCARDSDGEGAHRVSDAASNMFIEYGKLLSPVGLSEFTILAGFPGSQSEVGFSGPGFLVMDEDDLRFFGRTGSTPYFLPHEVAHQWFPQQVAHGSAEDAWMAEALAEYLAWRYLETTDPADARRMITIAMRDALAADQLEPISMGLRLYSLGNEITQQTLYDRGMLVWRTLETVMDREQVGQALRKYLQRFSGRTASIADFEKICEEISGRDLSWFFRYYIAGTEAPEISLRRTDSPAPNEASGEILISGAPPGFTVQVELRIVTDQGVREQSVAVRAPSTPFTVAAPGVVTRIDLDPGLRILRWTETARRNRAQRALLSEASAAMRAGEPGRAEELCRKALAADPENVAGNEQLLRFQMGQILFQMKRFDAAFEEMSRVLETASLDARTTDTYSVWAHVYRARIAWVRGDATAAREEAKDALQHESPALGAEVTMGGQFHGKTTAERELRLLLDPPVDTGSHR